MFASSSSNQMFFSTFFFSTALKIQTGLSSLEQLELSVTFPATCRQRQYTTWQNSTRIHVPEWYMTVSCISWLKLCSLHKCNKSRGKRNFACDLKGAPVINREQSSCVLILFSQCVGVQLYHSCFLIFSYVLKHLKWLYQTV